MGSQSCLESRGRGILLARPCPFLYWVSPGPKHHSTIQSNIWFAETKSSSSTIMHGSRGQEVRTLPPGKSQKCRCFSNIAPDPLENYKATTPACNVGPSSGWPMMTRVKWYLDITSPHQLKKNKNKKKKNRKKLDPLWENFSDPRMLETVVKL